MARDPVELVEEYASDDPMRWGRLSSTVQFRRLQLLLRGIVVELRKLTAALARPGSQPPPSAEAPGADH